MKKRNWKGYGTDPRDKGFSSEFDGDALSYEACWGRLHLLSREIGEAQKDDRTERVPFGSVTYDFDSIYGASGYGERTLTYRYDLLDWGAHFPQWTLWDILAHLRRTLHWQGRKTLSDNTLPQYFFEVREPTVQMSNPQNGVYVITLTFRANPAALPWSLPYELQTRLNAAQYPDVNGDGTVTAADASLILTAAENIAAGLDSGLTEEQAALADADKDGTVSEHDALLVSEFSAACSRGEYPDDADGWHDFLQRQFRLQEALY